MQTIRNTANSGTNKAKEQEEKKKNWDNFLRSVGVDTNKNMFQQAAQYAQRQQQAQAANATQQRPMQYSQLNQQQRQTVNPLIRNSLQEIRDNLQMGKTAGWKSDRDTTQTTTTPAVQRTSGPHPMMVDFRKKLQDRQQTMNRLQQEGIQQAKGIAGMVGQAANTAKTEERKPANNLQRQHMLGAGEATPESLGLKKNPVTLRNMMRQAGDQTRQKYGEARNTWDRFIQQASGGLKPYIPQNEGAEPNQTTYGDLKKDNKGSGWWIKDALAGKLTGNEKDEYIRSTSIAAFNSQFVQSINDQGKYDDQEGVDSYLYSPEKNRELANQWQVGVDYMTGKLDEYKDHSWLTNPEGSNIDNAENAAMDLLGGNLDRLTMEGISYMDANGNWVTIGGQGGRNQQTIEDYQQNEEFYNQLAFRAMFGQEALDIELAKNNGQLSEEYTAQMEKVWDHVLYDAYDLAFTRDYYQSKIDEALAMAEMQEKYKGTMSRALEDQSGMKNVETGFVAENENKNAGWQMGNTIDKVYSFINGSTMMEDIMMQAERGGVTTDQVVGNALDGVGFMTPDEIAYFNAYVNDGNKEGAERFLEEIKPSLKNRQRQWQEGTLQYLADRFPVLAAATSVATNKIQGFVGLADSVLTLTGLKTGNANDDMQFFSNMTETLRNTLSENVYNNILDLTNSEILAKLGQSLENTFLSVADFTTDAFIGTSVAAMKGAKTPQEVAKIGKSVSLGLMTMGTYATSYHEALEETGNPAYAALTAFVDGANELSTETILGMDDIFDFGAQGVQFFLGAILGEAAEELEGSVLSPFEQTLKSMLYGYFTRDGSGMNQWEKDAHELADSDPAYHYTDENGYDMIDYGKALKSALAKWGEEITWSAIGGGLGGGLGGIGTYGSMHAYERDTGKAVREAGAVTEATYESGEKAGQTKSNEDYLIDIAAGMKEDSRARKMALEMQKAKAAGKKISNAAVGRLASALGSETNERVNAAVQKSLSNQVAERLRAENGSEAGTTQAADIVAKAVTEGLPSLTKEERSILSNDPAAFDVYREFVENRTQEEGSDFAGEAVNTAVAAGEAEGGEILENIRAMTDEGFRKARAAAKATAKIMQGQAETAAHRAAERHTDKLAVLDVGDGTGRTTTGKPSEVVVGEEQAEIVGVKDGKYLVRSGEDTHTADMADVMATNKAMATTMSYIEMNRAAASDRFANLLIQGVNSGAVTDANVETYLNDANKIRIAAFHGQAMPQVKLDQKMVQMIYDQSRADAIAKDAQRTRPDNRIRLNPGNGAVKLMGVDSTDTKAYNAMLEQMGEAARDQVEAVASLFKKIGLNVSIVNDTSNKNVYGSYDIASGAVIVNLAGENQGGEQHHLLTTVSHELTHFLERNSREGYNALRQFVFEQIQQSGQDLNQLIENKINQYNAQISELNAKGESYDPITIDEAMAEVVADACDQVLSNEETINHLAQDNKGLYNKIRNFVKDFIGKIKKATAGMERSSSRYSRMIQDADRLAKLWNIAFDEATEPVQIYEDREGANEDAPMAASLGETRQNPEFSIAEFDDGEKYIVIDTDLNFLAKLNDGNRPREIGKYIIRKFKNTVIGEGSKTAWVDRRSAEEYARPANKGLSRESYRTKANAAGELENMLQASKFLRHEEDGGKHKENTGGWDVYELVLYDPLAEKYFKGNLLIEYVQKGRRFHDLTKLIDVTAAMQGRNAPRGTSDVYEKSIKQKFENDNREFLEKEKEEKQARKEKQLEIINKYNAMTDDYHTGIRTAEDIKTADEAFTEFINGDDEYINPDFTKKNAKNILKTRKLNVYSSKPISQGSFVTTSRMEAISYAGSNDIYAKRVSVDDVAWIDSTEGQYANIAEEIERAAETQTVGTDGTVLTSVLPGGTVTRGGTQQSLASWTEAERERVRADLIKGGFTAEEADKWIRDVNSVAAIIAADRGRLDYEADGSKNYLKKNQEYFFTLDASTLCAKRLLYQGTFNAVQALLPNTALMPEDLIDLYKIMKDMGYETPCGICYVESRRRWLGKFAEEWVKKYKGKYRPNINDVTSSEGLEKLRLKHPEAYDAFVRSMKAKGSANPKVVQLRTDYRGDISRMTASDIQKVIDIGGLRVQSFSDFEVPHLIDMMQAVIDMASKGLTSQAYTKVPAFAAVFGGTGIKINLSLIGKGVDANGNLLFDDVEGMPFEEAMKLRNKYSENVGTILVGMNDEHIIAAMADNRIDFIIPFHKSGWSNKEIQGMESLQGYKDYTASQNEKVIIGKRFRKAVFKTEAGVNGWISQNAERHPEYKVTKSADGFTVTYRDGYRTRSFASHEKLTKEKLSNLEPVGAHQYWEFEKSGTENAEKYLRMCAERNRLPKFSQFLVDNGDGSFSLPQGNDKRSTAIRNGYWKTLIDFKMYDNNGKGAEQKPVKPNINMAEARKVLDSYTLDRAMPNGMKVSRKNNNTLPVAQDVVDRYVKEFKARHADRKQFSMAELDNQYMDAAENGNTRTASRMVQEAAVRAGAFTDERGKPVKLFHGTRNFGFTSFDTSRTKFDVGAIFTTSNESVANGYSEFGRNRDAGSRYIQDDGTDRTIIRNAKNVLDSNVSRLTAEKAEEIRQKALESFGRLAEAENAAMEESPDYMPPAEIDMEFWEVAQVFNDALNEDQFLFDEDEDYRTRYREDNFFASRNKIEAMDKLRDFFYQNEKEMKRLKEEGAGYYKLLFNGYEHTDGIIDLEYGYKNLLDLSNKFINTETGNIIDRETLQNDILAWKDKGNYSLYGIAGDKPLIIDAKNGFWTNVEAPEIGEGTYSTDYIAKWAKTNGYTSLVIKNVMDPGIVNSYGDDYIFFDANQLKSADPVTYDDDGNVIPLSERFNPESDDIRWSMAEMNTSAIDWLAEVTQEEGSSWAEREIMRQYRERTDAVTQTRAKMRQMEEDLKTAEGDAARKLRINLQTEQRKLDRQTASLNELTGSDSWREQMRRAQRMMNQILQGETQADIDQRVQDLKKQVDALKKQATQAADRAEKLGRDRDVAMMRSLFGKNALNKAASSLKKSMRSSMTVGEIENALASISLKFAAGDPTHMQEVEALAGRLAETGSADGWGTESYVTDALRGTTISLTAEQWAEMKKVGYDKKTVRSLLSGTGVQFTEGKTYIMPIDTLLQDYLVELVPELRDIAEGNDKDMAIRIVELLAKEKENREAGRPPVTQDEIRHNMMQVIETAAALRPVVEMSDSGVKQLLSNIRGYLQEVSGSAEQVTEQIREISQSMESARTAATRVSGSASVLSRDTTEALDMLRTMGRAAASSSTAETDALKARLNKAIEYYRAQRAKLQAAASAEDMEKLRQTLESDATRRIMAERERWQQAIEQDKARRQLSQNRAKTRRQVERLYNRLTRLITEETDDKSIPEEYKSIARAALKSILQQELSGGKRITERDMKKLDRDHRVHDLIDQREGTDINLTVIEDEDIRDQIQQALDEINAGVEDFRNARGRSMPALEADAAALKRLHEGLKTVAKFIRAARETEINGRKILIADLAFEVDTAAKERDIHAERIGSIGQKMNLAEQKIYYGNMTPEYFFKSLKNKGLSTIWEAFHEGEDRSGILTQHFKEKIERIAEDNGYGTWDQSRKIRLELENGDSVNMTPEQMMSLYATYKREMKLNADMKEEVSHHLRTGGFVMEEQAEQMLYGKEAQRKVSHKFSGKDFAQLEALMDPSWKAYADAMVELMSTEGSALGNAASMKMYGIKKYNESYYFPFAVWDGVKNKASNAGAAINPTNNNRAAHFGFTNRLKANAGNAVLIRNFTEVTAEHLTQMVTHSTMGLPIETMNKVLNFRVAEDAESGSTLDMTQRNIEVVLEERYGKNATGYIRDLLRDLNGGVTQDRRGSMVESLMSVFKKNAVGGSLSVALQQPLSYIRAATMISPKYLAQAVNPKYWKGSYAEMKAHSGLAVIKDMGRFDMNYGQSAREYMTPEQAKKKGKAIYDKVVETVNIAPELMDRATWTRMWTACKLEMAAQNPGADTSSNAFLDQVAERFNDVMRKTQVYDSVLVKSSNMRSTNWTARVITAFKAEPTLTANMLMDAWQNRKTSGGKKAMGAALGTYLLSAIFQAFFKAIVGAGRTPDEKKTRAENVANKFAYNFIGEANPLSLIPGYSEIVDALSGNEIKDNAYGVITDVYKSLTATRDIFQGKGQGAWKDVENTVGQITQIVSGIPLKNLMRDSRAVYNRFFGIYADREHTETDENGNSIRVPGRETNLNVIRYQTQDTLLTNDLIGAINKFLGDAGYKTSNTAYYDRIYAAEKAGRQDEADAMREYLQLGKGAKEKSISDNVAKAALADYRSGEMTEEEYKKFYSKHYPDAKQTAEEKLLSAAQNDYNAGKITEKELMDAYRKFSTEKKGKEYLLGKEQEKWRDGDISDAELKAAYKEYGKGEEGFDDYMYGQKKKLYKEGKLSRKEMETLWKKNNPDKNEGDMWFFFDKIEWEKQTGKTSSNEFYYRIHDAIESNKAENINKAVKTVMDHGKSKKQVAGSISGTWDDVYKKMKNGSAEKVKLKDALIKAYKAIGYSAQQAENIINKWK